MTSLFRDLFDSVAVHLVFCDFGDPDVSLAFTDSAGVITEDIQAIWRAESSELVEDESGNVIDMTVVQIVMSVTPGPPYNGLSSIDLEGTFTKDGFDWDIDAREGRGVEAKSESIAIVHLISREPVTQQPPGRRR